MAIWGALASFAAPIVGDLIGGLMGNSAQKKANNQNVQLQKENQAWEERMSNTSYQRGTQDMLAAGLNPMLAYSQGGANTPNTSAATVSPVDSMARSVTSASSKAAQYLTMQQAMANIELTKANTEKAKAEATTAGVTSANAAERQNLEMNQIRKNIEATIQSFQLTEDQRRQLVSMMPMLIDSAKAQAKLQELQIPSARAEAQFWEKVGAWGTGAKEGSTLGKAITEIMKGLMYTFRK